MGITRGDGKTVDLHTKSGLPGRLDANGCIVAGAAMPFSELRGVDKNRHFADSGLIRRV